MTEFELKDRQLVIKLDTSEFSPQQVRLIKTVFTLMIHTGVTLDECDYFDGSADLVRRVAAFIKQANFNKIPGNDKIPFADQALEFSIDALSEEVEDPTTIISWDN